ncbi:hypothetical protein K7X08_015368 [Anisodus acutangulus]|uniref:HTH myb-type domain-containing protein n=1 Tax=Anisodus acutangulus TaxID=402998 RepID=A0A9Q1L611_9SOLA|nr:hypothetical protein K7X08_015368 [Anisodus acutangulus]
MNITSNSELSPECKPHQSYSMILKSFGEKNDQTQNLEEFLARLEEERVKIDAFKRELPLCMQLLTNAMEASRQQLQSHRENNHVAHRPVLEEFIPLKNDNPSVELGAEKIAANNTVVDNKANWMTSAQLWSPASDQETKQIQLSTTITSSNKENDHMGFSVSPKLALDNNSSCPSPTLALASSNKQNETLVEDHNKNLEAVNINNGSCINIQQQDSQSITNGGGNNSTSTQQPHRKARRCWSPDLHRRFVNALQILGGSQVATPKQIRELMKVDGLTNDEVKSHLQKYRLHTRRPSPSRQATTTAPPHLVVLGGIWVPPEYAATAAHGGAPPAATFYGPHSTSHAPSTHYIAAPQPVPQEFYSTPQPLQSLHHLQHHQQLYHHGSHMYKSHSHSSPESDALGTGHNGDRSSESIEDGKSESCSSENGGERKVVVQKF